MDTLDTYGNTSIYAGFASFGRGWTGGWTPTKEGWTPTKEGWTPTKEGWTPTKGGWTPRTTLLNYPEIPNS